MTVNMEIKIICQEILGKVTPQMAVKDLKYAIPDLQMTFGCIVNSLFYISLFPLQNHAHP